jgi:hypothetical protein
MQKPTGTGPDVAPVVAGAPHVAVNVDVMPTAIWQGAVAARRELNSQRDHLRDMRRGVAEQLRNPMVEGADRKGLEREITSLDDRIATLDKDIAAANARVAATALVPGAVVEERHERNGPPEEVYILSGLFFALVLFPLSVAFAMRIMRRGKAALVALPQEMLDRFTRLDQAVDAMAVEVERIGESQRFVTRLMSERAAPEPRALLTPPSS